MQTCAYCGRRLPLLHRILGNARYCSGLHAQIHKKELEQLAIQTLSAFQDPVPEPGLDAALPSFSAITSDLLPLPPAPLETEPLAPPSGPPPPASAGFIPQPAAIELPLPSRPAPPRPIFSAPPAHLPHRAGVPFEDSLAAASQADVPHFAEALLPLTAPSPMAPPARALSMAARSLPPRRRIVAPAHRTEAPAGWKGAAGVPAVLPQASPVAPSAIPPESHVLPLRPGDAGAPPAFPSPGSIVAPLSAKDASRLAVERAVPRTVPIEPLPAGIASPRTSPVVPRPLEMQHRSPAALSMKEGIAFFPALPRPSRVAPLPMPAVPPDPHRFPLLSFDSFPARVAPSLTPRVLPLDSVFPIRVPRPDYRPPVVKPLVRSGSASPPFLIFSLARLCTSPALFVPKASLLPLRPSFAFGPCPPSQPIAGRTASPGAIPLRPEGIGVKDQEALFHPGRS